MDGVSAIKRLRPTAQRGEDGTSAAWVALLSEWKERPEDLCSRIEGLFAARNTLPAVLVVEDVRTATVEHRHFLTRLTVAGATVLEPESEADLLSARTDPVAFGAALLATAGQAAGPPSTSPPGNPAGYEAFGTAFTRLSKKDMEDVIEGRRTDDWRYDS
jgi:hypothetical protein